MYQNLLELEVNTFAGPHRSGHKLKIVGLRKGLIASPPSEVNFGRGKKSCGDYANFPHRGLFHDIASRYIVIKEVKYVKRMKEIRKK